MLEKGGVGDHFAAVVDRTVAKARISRNVFKKGGRNLFRGGAFQSLDFDVDLRRHSLFLHGIGGSLLLGEHFGTNAWFSSYHMKNVKSPLSSLLVTHLP